MTSTVYTSKAIKAKDTPLDISGTTITVGSYIAYATSIGSSIYLRKATVTKIIRNTPDKTYTWSITVQPDEHLLNWIKPGDEAMAVKLATIHYPERIVVLPTPIKDCDILRG